MSTIETESHIPRALLVGGAIAAAVGAGGVLAQAEPAHAAMEPTAIETEVPHTITVTVQPGDSPYGLIDRYTDMTAQQIVDDLPRFYDLNQRTMLHPGEAALVPTSPQPLVPHLANPTTVEAETATPALEGSQTLKYGDVLWLVVKNHYGFVTPELVQHVAAASGFPDMNHYYANQTVVFPKIDRLASQPAPAVTPRPTPATTQSPVTAPTATSTTTTQPTASPEPTQAAPMPAVSKETAVWKAQDGKAVLGVIAVIAAQKDVPPATVASWMRQANPQLNLAQLKDGQSVIIPGTAKQEFSEIGDNLSHFAKVAKKNPQILKNFEAADEHENPRPPYTVDTNPLSKSGVSAEQIDAFLAEHAPAMAGLGKAFKQIEDQYGINAVYAVAHAGNESSWGTSNIARAKNNLFGRNAYDTSPMSSALTNNSYEASVLEYGAFLKNAYLTEPGQPGVPGQPDKPGVYFRGFSLRGVFDLYSTGLNHDQTIARGMNEIDPQIRAQK